MLQTAFFALTGIIPENRALERAHPHEAARLQHLAEQAVAQRWDVYEEMATHGAEHFCAVARKD
ncbi:MAG TPA: hypothetical protein VND62_01040 [Acidimicrobiales bacterium]|nr:hypothetical protein [Acidimicrobiales bacterium]